MDNQKPGFCMGWPGLYYLMDSIEHSRSVCSEGKKVDLSFSEQLFMVVLSTSCEQHNEFKKIFYSLIGYSKSFIIFVKEVCNFLQVSVQQESSFQGMGCIWMFYSARF